MQDETETAAANSQWMDSILTDLYGLYGLQMCFDYICVLE